MRRTCLVAMLAVLVLFLSALVSAEPTQAGSAGAVTVDLQGGASASSTNPCSSLPRVCGYRWDPVEKCCVADPRFDCYDVCF